MLNSDKCIHYEGEVTDDGADSEADFTINDDDDGAMSIGENEIDNRRAGAEVSGSDSEADCDVDEHEASSELPGLKEEAKTSTQSLETVQSPNRMMRMDSMKRPRNEVAAKPAIQFHHQRNLSDVLEERSSGLLSSGQVSVDKKFMSPDLLV